MEVWHKIRPSIDHANRIVRSESLEDFCRHTILKRADEILAARKRSSYRTEPELMPKVAEGPRPARRVGK